MKRCNYCKKDYSNNGEFCTVCGGRLTEITSDINTHPHINPKDNNQNIQYDNTDLKNGFWEKWNVYLTLGIGVLVWLYINQWVGLIICYAGVKLAYNTESKFKKCLTLFVAILASIISISMLG